MGCWEEVDIDILPEDANLIGVTWVFKIKVQKWRVRATQKRESLLLAINRARTSTTTLRHSRQHPPTSRSG